MAHVGDITSLSSAEITQVQIFLTAVSTSEWDYVDHPGNTEPASGGLYETVFTAEQTAESDSEMGMEYQEYYTSGENYAEDPGESQIEDAQDYMAWWSSQTMLSASIPVPGVMEALEAADMYLDDGYSHPEKSAEGDESAVLKYHATQFADEDGVDESDMSIHTASTQILWRIPYDEWGDENTIEISAKNVMGNTHHVSGYPNTNTEDGAEASVEIPISDHIKQTNAASGRGSEDKPLKYYTSEFPFSDHIYPEFNIDPKFSNNPWVNLYIEWNAGSEDYATTDKWLRADEFPVTLDHSYWVGDDDIYVNEWEIDFTLSVADYQGDWEYHETVYIEGINDEDDGGGGGGGGCPYVSPWTGDDYKRENNLLMDAEFEEGEVTDKYLLENSLQPKDGSYQMKIEEFEKSIDMFDQMQLYTLDHTKNTELGLTPDEELVSYSEHRLDVSESASLDGRSIWEHVREKDDGKRATVENNDTIHLDFGDVRNYRWPHSKLVVTASGFESYTDDGYSTNAEIKSARSLHFSIKIGDDDWTEVDVVHPRNNPSDHVIPLKKAIQESGFDNREQNPSLQVKINSTASHSIDRIAFDDSNPTPVKKKEADLESAIMKHSKVETDVTDMLKKDDHKYANIVPGEEIKLEFRTPERSFGRIFTERDFLLVSNGDYCKYEG